MELKWFFGIMAIILTLAILTGVFFIGVYQSNQDKIFFEATQKNAGDRFNISSFEREIHFNQTADLKESLDPIIATIPNATQSELDRQKHFNQTSHNFEEIERILEIKLQDHDMLNYINKSLAIIAGLDNKTFPIPPPVSTDTNDTTTVQTICDNGTAIIIQNITGENLTNKLPQKEC